MRSLFITGAVAALAALPPLAGADEQLVTHLSSLLGPSPSEPWLLTSRGVDAVPAPRLVAAADPAPLPVRPPTTVTPPAPMPAATTIDAAAPVPPAPLQAAPLVMASLTAPASMPLPRKPPRASARSLDPAFLPTVVGYAGPEPAGTIVIDTNARYLFLVEAGGKARRYGVGVGKPGFEWAGEHRITRKAEWPGWTPPPEMIARRPNLPRHMEGGPGNPLGARAMYLGSTLYRIHGTTEPWSIGKAVSSGCIRMRNEDVTDLYQRVGVGTRVIVM